MKDGFRKKAPGAPRYAMHRERLGEWAAVVCVALFVFLSFCWPSVPARDHPGRPLPEPTAAYVKVVFPNGFHGVIPQHGAKRIDNTDSSFSLLPRPVLPPLPEIPGVAFTPPPPPPLPGRRAPSMDLDRLPIEATPPPFPVYGETANTNLLFVKMSPALRDAEFTFLPPRPGAPLSFACTLDIGPDGRVRTLLLDAGKNEPEDLIPWRSALLAGHARTNAYGRLLVERREPAR